VIFEVECSIYTGL